MHWCFWCKLAVLLTQLFCSAFISDSLSQSCESEFKRPLQKSGCKVMRYAGGIALNTISVNSLMSKRHSESLCFKGKKSSLQIFFSQAFLSHTLEIETQGVGIEMTVDKCWQIHPTDVCMKIDFHRCFLDCLHPVKSACIFKHCVSLKATQERLVRADTGTSRVVICALYSFKQLIRTAWLFVKDNMSIVLKKKNPFTFL